METSRQTHALSDLDIKLGPWHNESKTPFLRSALRCSKEKRTRDRDFSPNIKPLIAKLPEKREVRKACKLHLAQTPLSADQTEPK